MSKFGEQLCVTDRPYSSRKSFFFKIKNYNLNYNFKTFQFQKGKKKEKKKNSIDFQLNHEENIFLQEIEFCCCSTEFDSMN